MKSRFLKQWQQFKNKILFRKIPFAILSWRYLLPNQSLAIQTHKQALKKAWPQLPRPLWWLMAIYNYTLWYLWFGWNMFFKSWFVVRKKHPQTISKSASRQLFELLLLTFVHTIPPRFYYQYRLYSQKESQWLDYIYTHELPAWHQAQSPDMTDEESRLLSDKVYFAEQMQQTGLPVINTIAKLKQDSKIEPSDLWKKQSLFLKPVRGSRKEGCYELIYSKQDNSYSLRAEKNFDDKQAILDHLQQQLSQQSLLIQPLLQNHALIAPYCQNGQLATIRFITGIDGHHVVVPLLALLEIPVAGLNVVIPLPIDIHSGEVLPARVLKMPERSAPVDISLLYHQLLPQWNNVIETVIHAHQYCPNTKTIGWDLALTDQGVYLIEGNINWGVAAHQMGKQPLLQQDGVFISLFQGVDDE